MSERFKELPKEKQLFIMRAATEVFAKYEYKKASTDLITTKAEYGIIRKGRMVAVDFATTLHERHTRSYTVTLESEATAKAFAKAAAVFLPLIPTNKPKAK